MNFPINCTFLSEFTLILGPTTSNLTLQKTNSLHTTYYYIYYVLQSLIFSTRLFGSPHFFLILWCLSFWYEQSLSREQWMDFCITSRSTGKNYMQVKHGLMEPLRFSLLIVLEWELCQLWALTINFTMIASSKSTILYQQILRLN